VDAARARLAVAAAGSSTSSVSMSLPSVTAGEVADDVAVRGKRFIDGFTKTSVDATMRNVDDASERLRVTVLNAAIQSEASATSDLPTLERAVIAMSDGTKDAIAEFEKRSRVIPQLRYELLENLSEKKLALEKRIEATSAPRELARKLALKQSMSRQP